MRKNVKVLIMTISIAMGFFSSYCGSPTKQFPVSNILSPIITFGDSTTALRSGVVVYSTYLDNFYSTQSYKPVIINAGVPGNTTVMGFARFQVDVLDRLPKIVIIQFGINDSMIDVWNYKNAPRVDLADYEINIRYFVTSARAAGSKVILMTPNPLRWTTALLNYYGYPPVGYAYPPPYDATDERGLCVTLVEYAEKIREIAADMEVELVDVYNAFEDDPRDVSSLLLDGMHPNTDGQEITGKLLIQAIENVRRAARINP